MDTPEVPKELNRVTSLSKALALFMFVTLPVVGFLVGRMYQMRISQESYDEIAMAQIFNGRNQIQSPSQASPSGEIEGWKTYEGQGFTFKYPPTWIKRSNTEFDTMRKTNKKAGGDYTPGTGWLHVEVLSDLVPTVINSAAGVDKKEDITLDNKAATRLTGKTGAAGTVYYVQVISSMKNNKTIMLNLSTQDTDLEKPLTEEFDQILSTFHFTQ